MDLVLVKPIEKIEKKINTEREAIKKKEGTSDLKKGKDQFENILVRREGVRAKMS